MAQKFYPVHTQPHYLILLLLSIIGVVGGILTLIPNPLASKPNILGYFSLCTFAPAATFFCCAFAGFSCTLRAFLFKTDSNGGRSPFSVHLAALALVALLLAGGGISAAVWAQNSDAFKADIVAEIATELPSGLKDGTFTGKWVSDEIEAVVEVTVSGGRIVSARLISGQNMPIRIAQSMFAGLVSSQSLKVDAVTGATASCSVVLKACEQALLGASGR